jgi:DNA polymerase III psi subunit
MPPTRITTRQQAYLDAMDIGLWRLRESACVVTPDTDGVPRLKLSPGRGGILLICDEDSDSASRLANDINRVLGSVPVWAWPHADEDGVELVNAVEENLFTTVGVFGDEVAGQFFDGDLPDSLQSANLVLLPSMQDIQHRAEARRQLWATFCRSGMVSVREHKT